jgi:ligand-binding sensor domain-containing protein
MRTETFKTSLLLLSLILFGSFQMLFPATGNIKFERITIKEGLSQSSVRSILQDKKGFMWFATVDG